METLSLIFLLVFFSTYKIVFLMISLLIPEKCIGKIIYFVITEVIVYEGVTKKATVLHEKPFKYI